MAKKGFSSKFIVASLTGLWLVVLVGVASAAEVFEFANGIIATIYTAREISDDLLTVEHGRHVLSHPSASSVELSDFADDWTSFDKDLVVNSLEAMHGFTVDVDVEVFLLPAPPANIGSSFARRGAIYLAPGSAAIHPQTMAYITTHEMGHVLTWAFLDGRSSRWNAYAERRGLTDANFAPGVRHADNAREILAEDIRHLFGGALATSCGSIENHELPLPDHVAGLHELLIEFFDNQSAGRLAAPSTAFPNPCNPLTTIEMSLPAGDSAAGGTAVLRIFDIRGTQVRTIHAGYVSNDRVAVQWNGTGDDGQRVASGRYLYVMQLGHVVAKGSVTLVK